MPKPAKTMWFWKPSKTLPVPLAAIRGEPVTAQGIETLWKWAKAGCPGWWDRKTDVEDPMFAPLADAVSSTDQLTLGALSFHPSVWVRIGIAGNFHTPIWAMWGDGLDSFGLAGDSSPWVRATVLARIPQPPPVVVATLSGATAQRPSNQAFEALLEPVA